MIDTNTEKSIAIDSIIQQIESKYALVETIDTCGTRCPIPLLRAKKALKSLSAGDYLLVLATDPSAKGDFDAMLRHLTHTLVDYQSVPGDTRVDYFVIQKGE